MRFTERDVDVFARLSGDRSPIHVDATYAGRTSFGQRVVHGVHGVLAALAAWQRGGPRSLARLRVTFRKPLFIGVDHELVVREGEGRTVLRWTRAGVVHADIVATLRDEDAPEASPARSVPRGSGLAPRAEARVPDFAPRAEARGDDLVSVPTELDYDLGDVALADLGLEPLAPVDVRLLAATSYLVGMEVPGRQALFTTLDVSFGEPPAVEAPFLHDLSATLDERFARVTLRGKSSAGASFVATAFVRPRPTDEDLASLRARPEAGRVAGAFDGKTVLVTGASRGFGAALARAFTLAGARPVIHYRAQRESAVAVANDAPGATLLEADLLTREGLDALAGVTPDVLVLNATPPIEPSGATELAPELFAALVARSVALVQGPCRAIAPRMGPGSLVVVVSSSYVVERPAGFAHYVAAKAAVEAFAAVLAKEHPTLRVTVVRPPRMLTDQTNSPGVAAGALAPPGRVALETVAALPDAGPLVEIE